MINCVTKSQPTYATQSLEQNTKSGETTVNPLHCLAAIYKELYKNCISLRNNESDYMWSLTAKAENNAEQQSRLAHNQANAKTLASGCLALVCLASDRSDWAKLIEQGSQALDMKFQAERPLLEHTSKQIDQSLQPAISDIQRITSDLDFISQTMMSLLQTIAKLCQQPT